MTGGELYFGLAESYQIRYLAQEIQKFKKAYPSLHYHITSGDTEQVTEKLDKGLLDFAVLAKTGSCKVQFYSFSGIRYLGAYHV